MIIYTQWGLGTTTINSNTENRKLPCAGRHNDKTRNFIMKVIADLNTTILLEIRHINFEITMNDYKTYLTQLHADKRDVTVI